MGNPGLSLEQVLEWGGISVFKPLDGPVDEQGTRLQWRLGYAGTPRGISIFRST